MSEFGRILTNLGLAYGLMNKEQFVERVARYAQENEMSEEKMMALVETLFDELEITHRRRQARQMWEAQEMKHTARAAENPDIFDDVIGAARSFTKKETNEEVVEEMRSLRQTIEKLTEALQNKKEGE
jgi:hypothetical protein